MPWRKRAMDKVNPTPVILAGVRFIIETTFPVCLRGVCMMQIEVRGFLAVAASNG